MSNKQLLQSAGDGTAVPAGYVGEILGTLRSGTGGSTYSTQTTTAATTTDAVLASVTLNKGIYLVFASIQHRKANNTTADALFLSGRIGGTVVFPTTNDYYASASLAGQYIAMSIAFPCVISTDSTVVSVFGKWAVDNGMSGSNTITVVRIA